MLNSVYAIQLLLWITAMSFNLLSRIYSLKVHKLSVHWKIRESMLVTDCAWKLILIITMCHMTANQANRFGQLIFSPYSSVSMKRVFLQESVEAATYFRIRIIIAGCPYCSYCWHYRCRSSFFTFDILSSDDLFSHPYLKCAADVSMIILSPVKEAREA